MASGSLAACIYRPQDKKTEPVPAIFWTSILPRNTHLTGNCTIIVEGAPIVGRVRIKREDLALVLSGKSAARSPDPTIRSGRKHNIDSDEFWVELCRVLLRGEVKEDLKALAKHMALWSINNMRDPYEEDTLRRKISKLIKAIR
jgi:hypothetical protein